MVVRLAAPSRSASAYNALSFAIPSLLLLLAFAQPARAASERLTLERLIETEIIERTDIEPGGFSFNGGYITEPDRPWLVSPDGRWVAMIVEKGDVRTGSLDAQLLVYDATKLMDAGALRVIATMSSTEAVAPITGLRWSRDSRSLIFLGARRDRPLQVYKARIDGQLDQLSHEATDVLWFGRADNAATMVVSRTPQPFVPAEYNPRIRDGFYAGSTWIDTLYSRGTSPPLPEMAAYDLATGNRRLLQGPTAVDPAAGIFFYDEKAYSGLTGGVSPDGKYGVTWYGVDRNAGGEWAELLRVTPSLNQLVRKIAIIDLASGIGRPTPFIVSADNTSDSGRGQWIDGGRKLLLMQAFEPFGTATGTERRARARQLAILEVDPRTLQYQLVGHIGPATGWIRNYEWDEKAKRLSVAYGSYGQNNVQYAAWQRRSGVWREVAVPKTSPSKARTENQPKGNVHLALRQSDDDPPKLVAVERRTGREQLVLDPDPGLRQMNLGRSEEIEWSTELGGKTKGVLFYPPDYQAGKRYPLVIQTHGARPGQFGLTGFAGMYLGRVLAANGIIVLQADFPEHFNTLIGDKTFLPVEQQSYETAIRLLDQRGLIDMSRIALTGWSATGPTTVRMLTDSKIPIVTAVLGDTGFQVYWYEDGRPESKMLTPEQVANGSFLQSLYPPVNLNKIHASILSWSMTDPFMTRGMEALGKPLEQWQIPARTHELYDIDQRILFGRLSLDWYRFWLQDYVDPDPVKAAQYRRWRHLRDLYNADRTKAGKPTLPELPAIFKAEI
jgi:dipeptidyl aminopeptidase/acylaminoacyl peptidase